MGAKKVERKEGQKLSKSCQISQVENHIKSYVFMNHLLLTVPILNICTFIDSDNLCLYKKNLW